MSSGLKILYASAEVVPFAKTGGLADVAGALPKVLAQMGHDVRIVMPRYSCIDGEEYGLRQITEPFTIPHGHERIQVSIEQSDAIEGVPTYFIRNDYLYNRNSLYGQPDDDHRFVAYCRGILEMLPHLGWVPDVINCNDWHTALVPVYLKTIYSNQSDFRDIGTLFTIHNLAYQGTFGPQIMELAGLPWDLFTWDKLAFWDKFNFMKAALIYADKLSTVSETYAKEIQTASYGEGLDGVLEYRNTDLYGILNGIDYNIWNPETDMLLPANFSRDTLTGKHTCKHELQEEVGLPTWENAPLFGLISRLSSQKGLDLLDKALPAILDEEEMQLVILGTGEEYFQNMLIRLSEQYPDKIAVITKFDNALAHRIYAGSDAFLMPSKYEPCGLGQMISLAYGTIPVVRATGGLADTIKEIKNVRGRGNGFVFQEYSPDELQQAIHRAIKCFRDKQACWERAMQNAFTSDFSW
ncbi:MAG TPA: glycogen/starch synthase, partial [Armatimonadota bacterium]|nr:glycogen/starch synthase [Armatimonadota bacterium]